MNKNDVYGITLVPQEGISNLWLMVYPKLEPAVERSNGRWTMKSLLEDLLTGKQQLWVAFDTESQIVGCATTQIVNYPERRLLLVQYLGGDSVEKWGANLLETLDAWALDNNCSGIEAYGRKGFGKWAEEFGYEQSYYVYEKPVGGLSYERRRRVNTIN